MGSSQTKSGGAVIEIERPYYYPNELLKGNLHLSLLNDTALSSIELKYLVSIKTSIKTRTKRYNQEQNIYDLQFVIPIPSNLLSKGQYTFPFSFVIPQNLPGSFEYKDRNKNGVISHKITANVKDIISHSTVFLVRSKLETLNYPLQLSDMKVLKKFCFFNKGISILNFIYDKNTYSLGENINGQCLINNTRCNINAKGLRLELYQKLCIRSERKVSIVERKICQQRIKADYLKGVESNQVFNFF